MAGQQPDPQSLIFNSSDPNAQYIDPRMMGSLDPSQMGGQVGPGGAPTVGSWMKHLTQPSLGPVDPNAMGGQVGPGQSPIGSIVSGQGQGQGASPLNGWNMLGGALGSFASGQGRNRILSADVQSMAAGAQAEQAKSEQDTMKELNRTGYILGESGMPPLDPGRFSPYAQGMGARPASAAQKQYASKLQQQLVNRKTIDPQDILKSKDPGIAERMANYGGLGAGALGGISAILKDQGKGGIPWGKVGSALHLPGSQPDWNQYNQQGGWTYDENGNKIPVPDSWYQPQQPAPAPDESSYDDIYADSNYE